VRHFHSWYRREHAGARSYSWVKKRLQEAALVPKARKGGTHRKRRERSALPGMMLHQDGSSHAWVADQLWDLIVTLDDATGEHYSMFFVEEEGTWSSLRGVREVIEARGLFSAFYSDRGSHYWLTPEAGGKVDKLHPTQFGRALAQLGITMMAAYSPEARGRSERAFGTHQGRLPQELRAAGITDIQAANRYLDEVYRPAFNAEFQVAAREAGSAFVPWVATSRTSCACKKSAWCARITVWLTRPSCCRFLPIATAAITSKRKCACMNTPTAASPSFMAHAAWRATTPTARN